jgi:hypothetical protein
LDPLAPPATEGYTAKHRKRPGLEALLALVHAGQVDVVII